MSLLRPLRGGCSCGRNLYIIQFPPDRDSNPAQTAQVLFDPHPSHRSPLATPLPTYLRVPLAWYHTLAFPLHADETNSQIHRVYRPAAAAAAAEDASMRHFCGFCGTPLSYWTESPRSEADFICLTLGSLVPEDLEGLEEWGVLPPSLSLSPSPLSGEGTPVEGGKEGDTVMAGAGAGAEVGVGVERTMVGERVGGGGEWVGALPWFDALTEGSRLGTLRRAKGGGTDRSGRVRVEWEVVEWSEDDVGGDAESPRKRKLEEVERAGGGSAGGRQMEGVVQSFRG